MSANKYEPDNHSDAINSDAINSAKWFTRISSGEAAAHEVKIYQERLKNDAEFSREQEKMAAIWDVALLLENDADIRAATAFVAPAKPARNAQPRYRLMQAFAAVAATVLLALGTLMFWPGSAIAPASHHYMTNVGEQKTITLEDGSTLQLNSGTRLRVQFSDTRRETELLAGEVTFNVAPDRQRPFEVHTQNGLTRVLGTVFNVEIVDRQAALVSVLEGRVQVVAANIDTYLIENQAVRYDQAGLGAVSISASERIRSWHNGRIRFDDWALKDILDEYNRYSTVKRYVEPDYEAMRFSGSFTLQDKHELIEAIESAFGISTHTHSGKPRS